MPQTPLGSGRPPLPENVEELAFGLPACRVTGSLDALRVEQTHDAEALLRHGFEPAEREHGDVVSQPVEGVAAALEVAVEEVQAALGDQMEVGRAVTVRRRVPTSLDRDEELRRPSALERAAAGRDGKHGVGVAVEEEHGGGGARGGGGGPPRTDPRTPRRRPPLDTGV